MDVNSYEVEESDCCGNGCANCILNANKSRPNTISATITADKINCLNQNRFYELLSIDYILNSDILKLKFQLKVEPNTTETENIQKEKNNLILYVPPGHHIMMKTTLCRRPYSPYWIDIEKLQFEFLVNLRPNGVMSKCIRQFKLGDLVEFKGPIGSFYHEINKYEHLLIFTNGIAVAPTIPIIEQILNNDDDMTRIHYFGCFMNLENFYFREKFYDYKQFWNFNGKIYIAKEICDKEDCKIEENENNKVPDGWCKHIRDKVKYGEKIYNFRLSNDEMRQHFNGLSLNKITIIICGSKIFEDFIKNCLENYEINKDNVYVL